MDKTPSRLGFTAAAMLGAFVAAAFDTGAPPTATAISSVGAEVGPADERREKHAHHHPDDNPEGSPIRGNGVPPPKRQAHIWGSWDGLWWPAQMAAAVALPATQFNGSEIGPADEEHHDKHAHGEHTHEEQEGSPDVSVALTGQAVAIEQGSITPSAPL